MGGVFLWGGGWITLVVQILCAVRVSAIICRKYVKNTVSGFDIYIYLVYVLEK